MKYRNIPFKLESLLMKAAYKGLNCRPSSAPYVSGDSFRSLADHVVEQGRRIDPDVVGSGDIVFVQAWELEGFVKDILPRLYNPFILITHNGDPNIDEHFSAIADHPLIMRWFAQNAILKHPKVTVIPIGLENRNLHYHGVITDFRRLGRARPVMQNRILYGFTVDTNRAEREPALAALERSPLADRLQRVNPRRYRKILSEYRFVASPPGNGVDCHRTWEAMYLRSIPIVLRSPMTENFATLGLPLCLVDSYEEVATWGERELISMYDRLSPGFESEALWFDYWARRIRQESIPGGFTC